MKTRADSPELRKVRSLFSSTEPSSFVELNESTTRVLLVPRVEGKDTLEGCPEVHIHSLGDPLTDATVLCPKMTPGSGESCDICEVLGSVPYDKLPYRAAARDAHRYLNVAQREGGRWVGKILPANHELYRKIAELVDIVPKLLRGLPLRIKYRQGVRKQTFSVSAYKRKADLTDTEFSHLVRNQVDLFQRYCVLSPQIRRKIESVARWYRRAQRDHENQPPRSQFPRPPNRNEPLSQGRTQIRVFPVIDPDGTQRPWFSLRTHRTATSNIICRRDYNGECCDVCDTLVELDRYSLPRPAVQDARTLIVLGCLRGTSVLRAIRLPDEVATAVSTFLDHPSTWAEVSDRLTTHDLVVKWRGGSDCEITLTEEGPVFGEDLHEIVAKVASLGCRIRDVFDPPPPDTLTGHWRLAKQFARYYDAVLRERVRSLSHSQ